MCLSAYFARSVPLFQKPWGTDWLRSPVAQGAIIEIKVIQFLKYYNINCSKLHESNLFEHFLCNRLFCIIYSVLFITCYLLLIIYCLTFDPKLLIYHLLSLFSINIFPHFKYYSETGGSRQMGPTQTQTQAQAQTCTQAHTQSGSCISQRRPLGGFTQGKATDRIVLSVTEKYDNLLI